MALHRVCLAKGISYDNAVMEYFFGIMKSELSLRQFFSLWNCMFFILDRRYIIRHGIKSIVPIKDFKMAKENYLNIFILNYCIYVTIITWKVRESNKGTRTEYFL